MFGQRVNPDRCLLRDPIDFSIESPTMKEYMVKLVSDMEHLVAHAQGVQASKRQ